MFHYRCTPSRKKFQQTSWEILERTNRLKNTKVTGWTALEEDWRWAKVNCIRSRALCQTSTINSFEVSRWWEQLTTSSPPRHLWASQHQPNRYTPCTRPPKMYVEGDGFEAILPICSEFERVDTPKGCGPLTQANHGRRMVRCITNSGASFSGKLTAWTRICRIFSSVTRFRIFEMFKTVQSCDLHGLSNRPKRKD